MAFFYTGLFFLLNLFFNSIALSACEIREIRIGETQLDSLLDANDIHYFEIDPSYSFPKVRIALFGHIYRDNDPVQGYLALPWLTLEKSDIHIDKPVWTLVKETYSTSHQVAVIRIQNERLEPDSRYRIGVKTKSKWGGHYALILDPVREEYEIEVEDIDFGENSLGHSYLLSTAYTIADPSLPAGVRTYVGTERGYLLVSEDDAKTWQEIYPPEGVQPTGTIYGLFVDSQGIIYASPWAAEGDNKKYNVRGRVVESRDRGATWSETIQFQWPTGVAWRITEDSLGNVFVGEYSAAIQNATTPPYTGNIWRRKNHGNSGETFEIVYSNPNENPDTALNHVHFVGVDPFTDDIYATIGDGGVGRFVRSKQHGDSGTWETLERGVDAQYTAIVFTPNYLILGQDTNRPYKKIIRWNKTKDRVDKDDNFWTTTMMDNTDSPFPVPYTDKGNWFWGHYLPQKDLVFMQYLPYGVELMSNGQMQPPRIYMGINEGNEWWRAMTFPPLPVSDNPKAGFYGPKLASNIGPHGWIYAMRGTVGEEIHRGFRFRLKPNDDSGMEANWRDYR